MWKRIEFRDDANKVKTIYAVQGKIRNVVRRFGIEDLINETLNNNGTIIITKERD